MATITVATITVVTITVAGTAQRLADKCLLGLAALVADIAIQLSTVVGNDMI